jgi:hypothetical protein
MPPFAGFIQHQGIILNGILGLGATDVRAARQAGRPVPPAIPINLLVDTGADVTFIDSPTLNQIVQGIPFVRLDFANTPGVPFGLTPVYAVGLTLFHPSGQALHNLLLGTQEVFEGAFALNNIHGVLGRDILARFLLVYDGPSGAYSLSW